MNVPGSALAAVLGGAAGLFTGSFLSVLVDRVPAGTSVLRPPGRCPHCAARLRFADMIPVAGWLRLRGRCRACGRAYGGWYPALELATGTLFAIMVLRFGFSPLLPAAWYLAALAVTLAAIDARHYRLPDRLTLPSYPAAVLLLGGGGLLLPDGTGHLARAAAGMAAALALYLLLAFIQPGGIGWGDVKLSGVIGFYLGWFGTAALLAGIAGGFVLAAADGLALVAAGKATRKSELPFGPFMLAATVAVIAAGGLYPVLTH